ncbi:hypothetical protein SS50377_27535 [Spironucleus salmonicida]|uniref:Uncharacterized protein n=1 Tax=Spironucleus salmonicida TaxID=348837 RepID=V6LRI0_9EUKA|nr:hypothetical protein SS50377_27535 [Spironucleus salmonicida]|eukprot:EST46873.1 Hypothetical protein SS50377_13024 [Spironucleus salmonicida]
MTQAQEKICFEVLEMIFGKLPEYKTCEELLFCLTGDMKSYDFFMNPSQNRFLKERILVSLQLKIRERLSNQNIASLHSILWA